MSTDAAPRSAPAPSPLPWHREDEFDGGNGAGDEEDVDPCRYVVDDDGHVVARFDSERDDDAGDEERAALAAAAVNGIHAIAPSRELLAARALPSVVEVLRLIAGGATEGPTDGNGIGVAGPRELAAMALANLGLLDDAPPATPSGVAQPEERTFSRDIYANVSRLRTALRDNAARWRATRDVQVNLTPEFVARVLDAQAGFLDLILKLEEKETTSPG